MAQGFLLMVAWFTALSRVHDYMHHPSDVLAGLVIGTVWALIVVSTQSTAHLPTHGDTHGLQLSQGPQLLIGVSSNDADRLQSVTCRVYNFPLL